MKAVQHTQVIAVTPHSPGMTVEAALQAVTVAPARAISRYLLEDLQKPAAYYQSCLWPATPVQGLHYWLHSRGQAGGPRPTGTPGLQVGTPGRGGRSGFREQGAGSREQGAGV